MIFAWFDHIAPSDNLLLAVVLIVYFGTFLSVFWGMVLACLLLYKWAKRQLGVK